MEYMRHQHNIKVGERTAEEIKIHVGSALSQLKDPPADYIVKGPNQMTALPVEVPVSYQEIAHCLEKSISKIETAVLNTLEQTPPELYADIVAKGIWLAGGGALLKGLDKRLTDKIGITSGGQTQRGFQGQNLENLIISFLLDKFQVFF